MIQKVKQIAINAALVKRDIDFTIARNCLRCPLSVRCLNSYAASANCLFYRLGVQLKWNQPARAMPPPSLRLKSPWRARTMLVFMPSENA